MTVARLDGPDPAVPGPVAHAHDFLVLLYAGRGSGALQVDGRTWEIGDGDLLLVAPGQVVAPGGARHPVLDDAWGVYFPPDVVRLAVPSAFSSWHAHPLLFPFARGVAERAQRLRVPVAERPAWVGRLEALDAELRGQREGYQAAVLAHLTLLLVAVGRLATDLVGELRSADEPMLAAVFDIVEARHHEPISLAGVAAELGLSPGHLTTVVRRRTGRAVQQWITERRMQEARRLLTETDLTVAASPGGSGTAMSATSSGCSAGTTAPRRCGGAGPGECPCRGQWQSHLPLWWMATQSEYSAGSSSYASSALTTMLDTTLRTSTDGLVHTSSRTCSLMVSAS